MPNFRFLGCLPRKLKFGMQAYFNPTRRNIKKQIGVTWGAGDDGEEEVTGDEGGERETKTGSKGQKEG